MYQVVYIDASGILARAEFSNARTACDYAGEFAQSTVINGDPYRDSYAGLRDRNGEIPRIAREIPPATVMLRFADHC